MYSQRKIACHFVADNWDRRSPFREEATSRAIFLDGVKTSSLSLATQAGFFSLLVFRGITFATPFLKAEKIVAFKDLADWMDITSKPRATLSLSTPLEIERYFCNMAAYGSASPQRKTSNAVVFWVTAGRWVDEAVQQNSLPIPYQNALQFLNDVDTSRGLPGIGSLQKMLLLGK